METKKDFINQINETIAKHGLNNYNQFNVFRTMFKMTEEKHLHSRFIAFLLNPQGTHGRGTKFLDLFLEELEMPNFRLDGVTVVPDEVGKSELDNIDILIQNKHDDAIIIENKIFAGDSNKLELDSEKMGDADPNRFQLPRYYNKATAKGLKVVYILYLTIDGRPPSSYDDFLPCVKDLLIRKEYLKHIQQWLTRCISELVDDSDLKRAIVQYKQASLEFLNDIQLAWDLKTITAANLDEGYNFWIKKEIEGVNHAELVLTQFIHVKWHIVYEFFSNLRERIGSTFGVEVFEIENKKITALTHRNIKTRISLSFRKNDVLYYVSNDRVGFSIGMVKESKSKEDYTLMLDNRYANFDFSDKEVFDLINPSSSNDLIDKIVLECQAFVYKRKLKIGANKDFNSQKCVR
ncbi:PD-(D/E)XK nuclease family protein [Sphingobacterium sp. UBA5996]|uniref:PDDEXK-like family protein n=1 Tax=Sphingobacterium sp. UBA5996 TaxID=1947505 RepID=UPI0025CBCDDD|nr:PD-(D/E)XK nuclease family protein [Sphingobacterium sp. UBA5996]